MQMSNKKKKHRNFISEKNLRRKFLKLITELAVDESESEYKGVR